MQIPKPKHKSLSKVKQKAWAVFSIYIRTRDCLLTLGKEDYGQCVTCGRSYTLKQLQAGHFIPGRHNSILFDERNSHAQCYGCNVMKKGNMVVYYKVMLKRYGQEVIDELEQLDQQTKSFTVDELEEKRKYYIKETQRIIDYYRIYQRL